MPIGSLDQRFFIHRLLFAENGNKDTQDDEILQKDNLFIFGALTESTGKKVLSFIKIYPETKIFWTTSYGDLEVFDSCHELFLHPYLYLYQEIDPKRLAFEASLLALNCQIGFVNFDPGLDSFEELKEIISKQFIACFFVKQETAHLSLLASHLVANLKHVQKAVSLESLKDKFKHQPILILGAGPSLDQLIPFLKHNQDRLTLFPGGTAMSILYDEDIKYTFGAAVCPNEEAWKRLQNRFNPQLLFSSLRCHPEILKSCQSEKVILNMISGLGFQQLNEIWGRCPITESLPQKSATVMTTVFALADYMGFDPIIIGGCDLGYGDKKYSGKIVSQWEEERFINEKDTFIEMISKTSKQIYVYESSLFQPCQAISLESLKSIFEKTWPIQLDQHLEKINNQNIDNYHKNLAKSIAYCETHAHHPFKEVFWENELAWNEFLKFLA